MSNLTHLDENNTHAVDTLVADETPRETSAEASITLSEEVFDAVLSGTYGDILAAARIAGIMAAKTASNLIPFCHAIALTKANVAFEPLPNPKAIRIIASVNTTGPTGVETEALTAASVAALTIYDMIKTVDRAAVINGVKLISKSGMESDRRVATIPKPRATLKSIPRKPETIMNEVAAPRVTDSNAQREAFRAFMTTNRLRATEWAKQASVPAAQIYAYLTGKTRVLTPDVASRLASAARVREEDMFRS